MADENQAERQKRKMQKLKEKVDQHIEACNEEKGVMILLTGDGKVKVALLSVWLFALLVMDTRSAWFSS
jgi:hypothetical protein